VFELQIHTPESFDTKMRTHAGYETARTANDRALKIQMERAADAQFAQVPRPAGAGRLGVPNSAAPPEPVRDQQHSVPGRPDGSHVNNRVLTPEQFAHALDVMRQEGRIHIGDGEHVRLNACDVGRGEDPPAARFARASGLEVTAPTERLWTNLRGEERVASA